jgi:hypothetical protein
MKKVVVLTVRFDPEKRDDRAVHFKNIGEALLAVLHLFGRIMFLKMRLEQSFFQVHNF